MIPPADWNTSTCAVIALTEYASVIWSAYGRPFSRASVAACWITCWENVSVSKLAITLYADVPGVERAHSSDFFIRTFLQYAGLKVTLQTLLRKALTSSMLLWFQLESNVDYTFFKTGGSDIAEKLSFNWFQWSRKSNFSRCRLISTKIWRYDDSCRHPKRDEGWRKSAEASLYGKLKPTYTSHAVMRLDQSDRAKGNEAAKTNVSDSKWHKTTETKKSYLQWI